MFSWTRLCISTHLLFWHELNISTDQWKWRLLDHWPIRGFEYISVVNRDGKRFQFQTSNSFSIYTKPKNNNNKTRIGILPTLSLNWETKPILSFFTSLSNNIIWAQKISEQNIPMPSLVVTVTYNYHSQNGTFAK